MAPPAAISSRRETPLAKGLLVLGVGLHGSSGVRAECNLHAELPGVL